MASTVNSTPTGNNASSNAVHTSQNSNGRTSLRSSASTRVPDNRRQSPVDGGARYVVQFLYIPILLSLSSPFLIFSPALHPRYTASCERKTPRREDIPGTESGVEASTTPLASYRFWGLLISSSLFPLRQLVIGDGAIALMDRFFALLCMYTDSRSSPQTQQLSKSLDRSESDYPEIFSAEWKHAFPEQAHFSQTFEGVQYFGQPCARPPSFLGHEFHCKKFPSCVWCFLLSGFKNEADNLC